MAEILLDTYDAELRPQGPVPWSEVHRRGLWHRTFHCWVVVTDPEPALLLQWRAPTSTNFPDLLDVSAAGHIESGETVADGIRELHEELGLLDIGIDDLTFAGERVEVADQSNGQHNREYQSVFFLVWPHGIAQLAPDPSEVFGIVALPLRDAEAIFANTLRSVRCSAITLSSDGTAYKQTSRDIGLTDLLPRIQRYYGCAVINAERLLSGEKYLAIS